MIDYDAYEKRRHETMREFGFGPEVMREIKICGNCGARPLLQRRPAIAHNAGQNSNSEKTRMRNGGLSL